MAEQYEVLTVDDWNKLRKYFSSTRFKSWAFRGQMDADWRLFSSLSRHFLMAGVNRGAWSKQEQRILRIFKRKAHLYLSNPPDEDDSFEWLSLMQHHGSPTRLLDFTWSPYVAAFFALESATKTAAIWALCPPKLSEGSYRSARPGQKIAKRELGPWVQGNYERYFLKNNMRLAFVGEPRRMNSRLIAQSGTFVMPGVIDMPLDEIANPRAMVKFEIDAQKVRKVAMGELYKMNINHSTLFPGLDGLARSLAYELEFHWAFDTETNKPFPGYKME
jgi:FRG domain